jgi:thiosulfate/3-mercaptopyruvate sulfurtransferase
MDEATAIDERGYAQPEVLVDTQWVADHLDDPAIRLVESNEDPLVYPSGHVSGAVEIDWTRDLNDAVRRDYVGGEGFSELCGRLGITPQTTVVFYGDRYNWWAAYACEMTRKVPVYPGATYPVPERHDAPIRAFRRDVEAHLEAGGQLVDVRSPEEFRGERLHMPDYPNEGALRGGHIPGARNVPWGRAVNRDGTFKTAEELRSIYLQEQGLAVEDEVIAYCRIGERSSHTWFVLTRLLGFTRVRNYDGSWTEWGNLVGAPITHPT